MSLQDIKALKESIDSDNKTAMRLIDSERKIAEALVLEAVNDFLERTGQAIYEIELKHKTCSSSGEGDLGLVEHITMNFRSVI